MDGISYSVKFNVMQNLRQQEIQAATTALAAGMGLKQISGRREYFVAKSSLQALQSVDGGGERWKRPMKYAAVNVWTQIGQSQAGITYGDPKSVF